LAAIAIVMAISAPRSVEAVEPGATVLITTNSGKLLRGRLIDKTPGGFLLSVRNKTIVVPYAQVNRIEQIGASGTSPAPRPAPNTYHAPPVRRAAPAVRPNYGYGTGAAAAPVNAPPKPRVPGNGLIVTGWILFGVGTFTAIVGSAAYSDSVRCDFDPDSFDSGCTKDDEFLVLSYAGGVLGTAGLVMAIIGHVKKGVAKGRLRRWRQKYQAGTMPLYERDDFAVTMSSTSRGQGLALGLHF